MREIKLYHYCLELLLLGSLRTGPLVGYGQKTMRERGRRRMRGKGKKGRAAGLLHCCCGRSFTRSVPQSSLFYASCVQLMLNFRCRLHTNTVLKLNFCCGFQEEFYPNCTLFKETDIPLRLTKCKNPKMANLTQVAAAIFFPYREERKTRKKKRTYVTKEPDTKKGRLEEDS